MRKSFLTASIAIIVASMSLPASATSLLDAYKDAMQNDPQTLKAKAQYEIARESEKLAFANLLPTLGFQGTYSLSNAQASGVETDTTSLSYGLSLSQSIFNMGDWYGLDASEKRALQALAGYDLAQQALISRVTQAYFNVLKAQDNLEFVRAEKTAIERQLEQTKQRFKVGLNAMTDVHEAQAKFDNAVATEIRSSNNVEIAKETLREITGKYYNKFDGLNTQRFAATMPQPMKVQQWVTKSENNNLELKAKELVVEAAKFDLKRADSGHYPTLNLSASYGSSEVDKDTSAAGITTTDNGPVVDSASVSLTLNVPLYTGGSTSAAIRQAQANYVFASEDREATHRSVVRQVRSSFADVTALVSTLKALEQSVISAESALQATQAGFEVGTRTIVDVLNSTQALYRAKSTLSSTRYDYILAMMSLKQSSGALTEQDIEAVNAGLSSM